MRHTTSRQLNISGGRYGFSVNTIDDHASRWDRQCQSWVAKVNVLEFIDRIVDFSVTLSCRSEQIILGSAQGFSHGDALSPVIASYNVVSKTTIKRIVLSGIHSSCGAHESYATSVGLVEKFFSQVVFSTVEGIDFARRQNP